MNYHRLLKPPRHAKRGDDGDDTRHGPFPGDFFRMFCRIGAHGAHPQVPSTPTQVPTSRNPMVDSISPWLTRVVLWGLAWDWGVGLGERLRQGLASEGLRRQFC